MFGDKFFSQERGQTDQIVTTINRTYPWSSTILIFRNGQTDNYGDRKNFDDCSP